ncbi:DUF2147 domain-containing protein [Acidocella sp.]|uniref:DUF2147 domain-containing protein n=1 Tax=Acidocella sp. TaxID=50710 RepID=UPI00260F96FE|nr:DUF2147 domain-containing protein [Acidocella sp.]MDD2794994.1 DUF2147 domain-containing protein [Acidocella sp.]
MRCGYSLVQRVKILVGGFYQIVRKNSLICLGDFALLRFLRGFWLAAAVFCGGGAAFAASASVAAPVGNWLTADHSAVIQVAPCGGELCGRIVGIALKHPGDPMPVDWRGQPQCGEVILQTALMGSDGDAADWVGRVLDPRSGNVYHASIALDANHDLRMRGYLGLPILGQTQIWQPYEGQMPVGCKLARR